MSISALLKKHGHETSLVMTYSRDDAAKRILALSPDVVGFSTLTATGEFEWGLEVAKIIKRKKPSVITMFGGMHPTLFPEESIENSAVDMICAGEGEYAMLELCDRLDKRVDSSDIANIWVKTSDGIRRNDIGMLIENLDELPFPDRELYHKSGYFKQIRGMDVMAGRHCPFECSYCYNHIIKDLYKGRGKFFRKHSVSYVINELKELIVKYQPESFTFVDEFFSLNKDWLSDFADMYHREIKLPFICNVRADTVDDEIASMLSRAGATTVCIGLETGNEKLRSDILNKPFTNNRLAETTKILHSHRIKFLTANMFGIPGENIDNAFETVELNQRIKTDFLYFSVFQPYPGLDITKRARQCGLIGDLKPSEYNNSYFRSSLLEQKDIGQITNLHKIFVLVVKYPLLKPLFRVMIKLPSNFIFDIIFMISFGWMQLACFKRSLRQLFMMGIANMKIVYKK